MKEKELLAQLEPLHQFEYFCDRLLESEGFTKVALSKRAQDLTVDFLIHPPGKSELWVVQSKLARVYRISQVYQAVHNLVASKKLLQANCGLLIIPFELTPRLSAFIQRYPSIVVWDVNQLNELIEKHRDIAAEFVSLRRKLDLFNQQR
ncbi:restriction endonuclease [Phormidium sp. CCY1219]|uniref:restriction endonuclease n=1 Tax=Phormidium sp. CCY1219 TaxID=2886104 RepID=UPI002D1EA8F0|nr:restriction endonuclease [Phormidium sp. CCY1219]MEB3826867.1 restriction endonuclease [Phormidium sp. CCY1219]